MSEAGLSRGAQLWALAAAIPFLLSLALLGMAFSRQVLLAFAIGWPLLQMFGYAGALKRSGGQIDHPLVKAQVVLHWMMFVILIAIFARVL
ncbi:MAG: pyridoxal phosphate biosynthetic protein [Erythrobacter sp.]|nr:pyridoxal phosphate biosynthetic protein [Erythrobacter sp.]NNC52908.1 pyridoxal phosphate biosynthetic protein [Erythrobacter sp.]